jgi:phosphatidylglycerophosphatase A
LSPGFVIPVWLVILIIFRELFITILRIVAVKRGRPIKTEYTGKVKTVFQMFTVFCLLLLLLLKKLYFPLISPEGTQRLQWTVSFGGFWGSVLFFLPVVLVALSAFLALLSMVQYLFRNFASIADTDTRDVWDFLLKLFSTGFFAGYFPLCPGTFASLIGVALWIFLGFRLFFSFFALVFTGLSFFFSKDIMGFLYLFGGFVLFRVFDIFKPPPIKNLQKAHGGLGIMLDDIVCAAFANGILQILRLLLTG